MPYPKSILKQRVREEIIAHLEGTLLGRWDEAMTCGYGDVALRGEEKQAMIEVDRIKKLFKIER